MKKKTDGRFSVIRADKWDRRFGYKGNYFYKTGGLGKNG
jgi:hypothetical protein